MVNCQSNKENSFIEICDKGTLVIRNGLFINNSGQKSLIGVTKACVLQVMDTNFESNENSDKNYGSCINTAFQSHLKLKRCNFINHRGSDDTDVNSVCVIGSEGNAIIKDCHFRNNRNDHLCVSSICFDVLLFNFFKLIGYFK